MAANFRNVSAPGFGEDTVGRTDTRAMTVATALFFMVGFLTCLNDVLSPHLKSIFALNYAETQSIPFYFFSSYFVFSYPSGKLVENYGYKKTMVAGLLVMALGALAFLPAAHFALFPLFLAALVILAAGMTVVQVAINPYVTVIGPARTAASRLNFAQAVNSFGTFIAPFIGTQLILRHASEPLSATQLNALDSAHRQMYQAGQASTVRIPYMLIALALAILALALATIKLKTTTGVSEHTQDFRPGAFAEALARPDSIWRHGWLLAAAVGIFTYVGAEVSIGNLLVSYMGLPNVGGLLEHTAGYFLMAYWGGAMVGRFLGSALLQRLGGGLLLGVFGIGALVLVLVSQHSTYAGGVWVHPAGLLGWHWTFYIPKSLPMLAMLSVGFFNSIMFPTIFTLGIQDLGHLTSKGSSLLVAAILGGAVVPKLQGLMADRIGLQTSFILPVLCYVYITLFGLKAIKRPPPSDSLIPAEPV